MIEEQLNNGNVDFSDIGKNNLPVQKNIPKIDEKDLHKIATKVAVTYDSSKLSDLKYIFDIFSPEFDKFKSLAFIQKTYSDLIAQGYPQTPALNEYLFWAAISRRMQILYQEYHKHQMKDIRDLASIKDVEDIDFLESMQSVAEHLTALQKTIDSTFAMSKQSKDVVDLHKETCEKAVKFLKSHFGEYVKNNSISGKITDITDKAYWAFIQDIITTSEGNDTINYVWSEELKFLFDKRLIPIEYMAFILRTSIEALYYVASIRNDKLEEINKEESEKKLKELMLEFEQIRDSKDREIIEK